MSRHVLFQLSDIHLLATGTLSSGIDPRSSLARTLEVIERSPARPEALVLTGDLADKGEAPVYAELRRRMDALAASLGGAAVVYVPGNHDDRAAFRRELLGDEGSLGSHTPGDRVPGGVGAGSAGGDATEPIDQVCWFGGLRLVALDTTVPGEDAGELRLAQLEWLAGELATPAPDGTVLALHHPPVPSPIRSMAAMALAHPDHLRQVIEGTDVHVVLAGHNHHASAGVLGTVPVFVAPAVSYRSDPLVEAEFTGRAGSAFARIDLGEGGPLVTVVPVDP